MWRKQVEVGYVWYMSWVPKTQVAFLVNVQGLCNTTELKIWHQSCADSIKEMQQQFLPSDSGFSACPCGTDWLADVRWEKARGSEVCVVHTRDRKEKIKWRCSSKSCLKTLRAGLIGWLMLGEKKQEEVKFVSCVHTRDRKEKIKWRCSSKSCLKILRAGLIGRRVKDKDVDVFRLWQQYVHLRCEHLESTMPIELLIP